MACAKTATILFTYCSHVIFRAMVQRGESRPKGDAWKRATIGNAAAHSQWQEIACEACGHRVTVAAAELMRQARIPPDTPFWTIAQRLVCGACGSLRVGIRAASHDPYRGR